MITAAIALVRPSDDPGQPASTALPPTVTIRAVDDEFDTPSLTITPGTTIEWTNTGSHTHHLVRLLGGEEVSGDLAPGGAETVTFNTAGDYKYFCSIHDGMTGQIQVSA